MSSTFTIENLMTDERISRTLDGLLNGTHHPIEFCRRVADLKQSFPDPHDPDLLTIIGIESETDHFPLGNQRSLWNESALAEKDHELNIYIAQIRDALLEACHGLRNRLGKIEK